MRDAKRGDIIYSRMKQHNLLVLTQPGGEGGGDEFKQ